MLSRHCATSHHANDVGCWEFRPCSSCQHNRRGTCGRAAVLLRGQGHRRSVAGEHKQRSLPSCSVSGLLRDQARWWSQYHTACAEEEAIRTGAFLPTDSQKELAFADAKSLMSPPAHIQTQREDGCSSRASSSLTVVSRQHLGSRFSHSDAGEGSQSSSRSRGSQDANP